MIQLFCDGEERRHIARILMSTVLLSYALSLVAALSVMPIALKRASDFIRAGLCAASYVVLVSAIAGIAAGARCWSLRYRLPLSITALVSELLQIVSWMVPLVVFVAQGSILGIFGVIAFAVASSKLVTRFWELGFGRSQQLGVAEGSELQFKLLEVTDSGFKRMRFAGLTCVAYFGVLSALSGNGSIALLCLGISGFFIHWTARDYGGELPRRQRFQTRVSNLLASTFLAFMFTFVGLLAQGSYLNLGLQMGKGTNDGKSAAAPDQFHSVVILLTPQHAAMPLIRPQANRPPERSKQTLRRVNSILFSGEYWFSPRPLDLPPASAFREFGDPTSIKVTEDNPLHPPRLFEVLVMQARQKIGQSIDLRCCRFIDVVVRNEDLEPAAVVVELFLVNSAATGHNSQSLGSMTLSSAVRSSSLAPSSSNGEQSDGSANRSSVLRFSMPSRAPIRSFDEMVVWFHLQAPRSRRAASVAIQRFDLIQ